MPVAVDGLGAGFVEGEVGLAEGEIVSGRGLVRGADREDEGRREGAGGRVDGCVVVYAGRGYGGGEADRMAACERFSTEDAMATAQARECLDGGGSIPEAGLEDYFHCIAVVASSGFLAEQKSLMLAWGLPL